ncbi:hypothetical protein EYF80_019591 [Liparis tanakae]|uniref:Uncharacterized protein n=1 Tax=Liparis tanakae TaxID=230148 RepID=A0A4Z2HXF2_9TELE|nr:hypothetical protein EYF80_019591 [Liparis tanakae]
MKDSAQAVSDMWRGPYIYFSWMSKLHQTFQRCLAVASHEDNPNVVTVDCISRPCVMCVRVRHMLFGIGATCSAARNTSVDEVTVAKWKASSDGEGPKREKKRRLALKDTKQETGQDVSTEAPRAEFETKHQQQAQLIEGGCGCCGPEKQM